jgi:membrane protease YdiL (CAAX protease family)
VSRVDERPGTDVTPVDPGRKRVLTWEIWLVALLSLLQSGIYAVVQLIGEITSEQGLSASRPLINASRSARPWLDLTYQVLGLAFAMLPVALVCYLLFVGGERPTRVLGVDLRHKRSDVSLGVLLAAVIGIPGLLLYLGAHAMGWAATVVPTNLPDVWWRIPILLLSAAQNAILEETVVVGYLLHRLAQLGWRPWPALAASALLRGSYHLYQGVGAFVGNAVMGVIFGRVYQTRGRTAPLIVAHFLIDSVAFVGYVALHGKVSWLP